MRIKKGERGRAVADIQARLLKLGYKIGTSGVDEVFGEDTEKALKDFQKKRGLRATGTLTGATWAKLVEESYELGDRLLYFHYPYFRGNDVRALQEKLKSLGFNPGQADEIFGPQTLSALKEFQQSAGLLPDGILGYSTLKALAGTRTMNKPGTPALKFPRRKEEGASQLAGKCVCLNLTESKTPGGPEGFRQEVAAKLAGILKGYRVKVQNVSKECAPSSRSDSKPDVILILKCGSGREAARGKRGELEERLLSAIGTSLNRMAAASAACREGGAREAGWQKIPCAVIVLKTGKNVPGGPFSKEEEAQKIASSIAEGLRDYFRDLP